MDDLTKLIIGILLLILIICGSVYINRKLRIDNFQKTIENLSDEQKCMHICGFQYPGTVCFDQYKFCLEKCDRISEREHKCGDTK